jgi:hypothetical protein
MAGKNELLQGSDLDSTEHPPADFTSLGNSPRFRQLFEGRDNDTVRPLNTCLHLHQKSRLDRPTHFSTDIDSVCGFAQSLGFCAQGFNWYPRPHRVSNITNNLHGIFMPIRRDLDADLPDDDPSGTEPAEIPTKISDVQHITLGRVFSGLAIDVFVLFPNLIVHRDKSSQPTSNFLTDEEECIWNDAVFIPSLFECLPSTFSTELPASWHVAVANSLASSTERAHIEAADSSSSRPR